jgi:hypothetical protein
VSGRPRRQVKSFGFEEGEVLCGKYRVLERIGKGWEGEVYLAREQATGIERSVKLFFPHRDPQGRVSNLYARKLHRLRQCPILIQYHTRETLQFNDWTVRLLVSEYVEGELLSSFLRRQPGRRLDPFQALHMLHALAVGIEQIHNLREYHGDLHSDNVIVRRRGIGFTVKLVDLFHWGPPTAANIHEDVYNLIVMFHECLGGRRHYAKLPPEVRWICCGLKRTLIRQRFRGVGQLRQHLENMAWDSR